MPWVAVLAVLGLTNCGDGARDPLGPVTPEASVRVSDPVMPVPLAPAGPIPALSIVGADDMVTYVAFSPGTAPDADSVRIRNRSTGLSLTAAVLDGGLDPVAIPAVVGDTIEVATVSRSGTLSVTLMRVPLRTLPIVVRTRPRKGRTAVPITLSIGIVFSEPIDRASITTESVQLLRGAQPVPANLQPRPDGLGVDLIPDQLLDRETEYTIVVTTEVRDLSGDRPEVAFTSNFTTAPSEVREGILFQSKRSGGSEIYVMKSDGSNVARLTYEVLGGTSYFPAVSPDGRKIAFVLWVEGPFDGGNSEVYVMSVDGTGLTNLSSNAAGDESPAWSPDGSKIAFVGVLTPAQGGYEVYVMNADGTGQVNLSNSPGWDLYPTWSPDGTHIAFASERDGRDAIYVMNMDGTGVIRLTDDSANANQPAWSPDGSKIAFMRDLDIYVMNADGTGAVNLTAGRAFPTEMPAWSPDGSRIAFVSGQSGGSGIYVMNADGTGITQISFSPQDSDEWPSWSP